MKRQKHFAVHYIKSIMSHFSHVPVQSRKNLHDCTRCIWFTVHFSHFLAEKGQSVANIVAVAVYQHVFRALVIGISPVPFCLPRSENAHSPSCYPGSIASMKPFRASWTSSAAVKLNLGHCSCKNVLHAFGVSSSFSSITWDVSSSCHRR